MACLWKDFQLFRFQLCMDHTALPSAVQRQNTDLWIWRQSWDASGKLAALLSPTCLFKQHIVATAEKWWAELAGLATAEKTCIWFVAADECSHTVYCVIKLTGVAHQKET